MAFMGDFLLNCIGKNLCKTYSGCLTAHDLLSGINVRPTEHFLSCTVRQPEKVGYKY
ncbi:hypothetical protein MIS46_10320 [Wielerella bovis]|uniref:hypothetical protein n=1 Tax=Wielerella bovis TaxID=2917790 RepID=UPI002018983E|nr:hypothetical protein [Wielerella bovis]ULJ62336.1 hypothetical protein MIS46_10320 [Wielerella bovis]